MTRMPWDQPEPIGEKDWKARGDSGEFAGIDDEAGKPIVEYAGCGSHSFKVAPNRLRLILKSPRLLAAAKKARLRLAAHARGEDGDLDTIAFLELDAVIRDILERPA